MRWPYSDKRIEWNPQKSVLLLRTRGISFQDVVLAIENERNILDITPHSNQRKYPGQIILFIIVQEYACVVPFVMDEERVFLKTIYKSRKFTKIFINNNKIV